MARQNLNKVETAATLGIARSTLDRYLSGATSIPPVVALACAAVAHGLPPIK
jgi:predicted DNA-binding transcriptional regulator AlpA